MTSFQILYSAQNLFPAHRENILLPVSYTTLYHPSFPEGLFQVSNPIEVSVHIRAPVSDLMSICILASVTEMQNNSEKFVPVSLFQS